MKVVASYQGWLDRSRAARTTPVARPGAPEPRKPLTDAQREVLELLREHDRLRTFRHTVAMSEGRSSPRYPGTRPDSLVSGVVVAALLRRGLVCLRMSTFANGTWDGSWWAEITDDGRRADIRRPLRWRRRAMGGTPPESDRVVYDLEGEHGTWVELILTAPVDNARYRCWEVHVRGEYLDAVPTRRAAYALVAKRLGRPLV